MNFNFNAVIETGKLLPVIMLIQTLLIGYVLYAVLRKRRSTHLYFILSIIQSSTIASVFIHYNNQIVHYKQLLFHIERLTADEVIYGLNHWLAFLSYEFAIGIISFLIFFFLFVFEKKKI